MSITSLVSKSMILGQVGSECKHVLLKHESINVGMVKNLMDNDVDLAGGEITVSTDRAKVGMQCLDQLEAEIFSFEGD